MTSQESYILVGIRSTVEKRAKRMPDIIVETTHKHTNGKLGMMKKVIEQNKSK